MFGGGQKRLAEILSERIKRLDELAGKLQVSVDAAGDRAGSLIFTAQRGFIERWPAERDALVAVSAQVIAPEGNAKDVIARLTRDRGDNVIAAVQQLSEAEKSVLTDWLDGIVAAVTVLGRL